MSYKIKIFFILFLTYLFLSSCFAKNFNFRKLADEGESNESSKEETYPFEWSKPSGKINNSFTFFQKRYSNFPNYYNRLDFELEESVSNTIWTLKATPWIYIRSPNMVGGYYYTVKPYFELKEGWIEHTKENFDIKLGNQIITWGAADVINPTDQWNARDLVDPFNVYKLPQPTLRANIHPIDLQDYSLEILFTPLFRANRLPVFVPGSDFLNLTSSPNQVIVKRDQSRWLIPMPTQASISNVLLPLKYKVTEPTYPPTWQAGARLKAMRISNWDFSASYQNIIEKTPRFSFNKEGDPNDPELPITLTLLPSFHRSEIFGFDAAGAIELTKDVSLGTRVEVAYNKRDNSRALKAEPQYQNDLIKDDFIFGVINFDYTFQKKFFGTVIYLNTMYIHYQNLQRMPEIKPGIGTIEGLPNVDPFDRNFVLYLESRINQTYKLSNALMTNLRHFDGVTNPSLQIQIIDNLSAQMGASFFFGRENTFYGQFKDNNFYNLNLKYVF
jgi:hypothetical protein